MDGIPSKYSLLRDSAFKTVSERFPLLAKTDRTTFLKEVCNQFIQNQVESFPEMCEDARVQNLLKRQELEKNGKQGKYSGSYGWSEDRNFKFDYDIPENLYLFMQNLIYKDFWSDSNRKIWRKFMKRVVDGDDPGRLLIWVKSQYGPNSQEGIVN